MSPPWKAALSALKADRASRSDTAQSVPTSTNKTTTITSSRSNPASMDPRLPSRPMMHNHDQDIRRSNPSDADLVRQNTILQEKVRAIHSVISDIASQTPDFNPVHGNDPALELEQILLSTGSDLSQHQVEHAMLLADSQVDERMYQSPSLISTGEEGGAEGTMRMSGSGPRESREETESSPVRAWKEAIGEDQERLRWERTVARGKMAVGKGRGWACLPPNLLRYIFTMALDQVEAPDLLRDRWQVYGTRPECLQVILMQLRKRWLAESRAVCVLWKRAVEVHPFWLDYLMVMDPSTQLRPNDSHFLQVHSVAYHNISDPADSPLPEDKIYSLDRDGRSRSWFTRANSVVSRSCLACRINDPLRDALRARSHRLTPTDKLGFFVPCNFHVDHVCQNCLREDRKPIFDTLRNAWIYHRDLEYVRLKTVERSDTNELGNRRRGQTVCSDCRSDALSFEGGKILQACDRGGAESSVGRADTLGDTASGSWYTHLGNSTAKLQANQAIEELWLCGHTDWMDLMEWAIRVQIMEQKLKRRMITGWANGMEIVESETATRQRRSLLARLKGYPDDSQRLVWEDTQEMARLRAEWRGEAFLQLQSGVWEADDDDVDDELGERWWDKLKALTTNTWIRDRVLFGFWVSPSDEVSQLASPSTVPQFHDPVGDVANSTAHPFPNDLDKPEMYEYAQGRMDVRNVNVVDPDLSLFLPPHDLLKELDEAFAGMLRTILLGPFRQIVNAMMDIAGGDCQLAERMCQEQKVDNLMGILRGDLVWYKNGLTSNRQRLSGRTTRSASYESIDLDAGLERNASRDYSDDECDDDAGTDSSLQYHELEDGFLTESDEGSTHGRRTPSPLIEHYEEATTKLSLNLYDIEEVEPSSPQSVSISDEDDTEPDILPEVATDRNAMHCGTRQEELVVRTDETGILGKSTTALGKRKSAPEGLQSVKASKERKSESPNSDVIQAHETFAVLDSTHDSLYAASQSSDSCDSLITRSSPDILCSEAGSLSRSATASTLNSTVLGVDNAPEMLFKADELDDLRSLSRSAITPCGPGVDVDAHHEVAKMTTRPPQSPTSRRSGRTATPTESAASPHAAARPQLKLIRPMGHIPWIPGVPVDKLGPRTQKLIEQIWWDVRSDLRECDCSICTRATIRRRT